MKNTKSSGNILIVDDNLANLKLLSELLIGQGYAVRAAKSGKDALASVQSLLPDLVLLDIVMPDINGYDVCSSLKANEKTAGIPVIFLSALNETKDKIKGFEAGGLDFINKPFDVADVLARVRTHMQLYLLREELLNKTSELQKTNLNLQNEIDERKLTEEALKESEKKWKSLVDITPDYIAILDKEGRFLFLNHYADGFSEKDVIGNFAYEYVAPESKDLFINKNKECIQTLTTRKIEYFAFGDNKSFKTYEQFIVPYFNNSNEINILAVARDITERKQAEILLRESERKLREVQEMAHLGFWSWDVMTGEVEWSEEVYKIFCINPKNFIPHIDSILDLSPWPEDHQRDKELINKAMESHLPGSYEQKFLRPDKSIGYYNSTFQGNYDEKGNLISIVGTVLDITERKLAQETLLESRAKYQAIFESTGTATLIVEEDATILMANNECYLITGYTQTELIGQKWIQYVAPESLQEMLKNHQLRRKDPVLAPKKYEVKLINKQGEIRNAILDIGMIPGTSQSIVSMLDITEHKRAEEELRSQKNTLDAIFESSPYLMMLADMDGRVSKINKAGIRFTGKNEDEIQGRLCGNIFSCRHAFEDAGCGTTDSCKNCTVICSLNKTIKTGESIRDEEGSISCLNNGEEKKYNILVSTNLIKQTDKSLILISIVDFTERKKTEEDLRESEEKFKNVFENAPVGKSLTLIDGTININQAFCKMLGYSMEELKGKKWLDITHPEDLEITQKWVESLLSGEKESGCFQKRYIHKNGTIIWTDVTTFLQKDKNGKPLYFITTVIDITQKMLLTEKLQESEEIFTNFMEHSPIYVFFKDEQIRSLRLSKNYEQMLGRPLQELLGKNMYELFPSDLAKKMVADDLKILNEGKQIDIEEELNGRYYSTIKFPISIEGKPMYLAGYTIDITDRKQIKDKIESQYALLKAIVNSPHDLVIFSLDRNYGYTSFNDKHREEMKKVWNADIDIGDNLLNFMAIPELKEAAKKSIDRALCGESFTEIQHQPDLNIYNEFSWNPVFQNSEAVGATVFIRDITERRHAEEELKAKTDFIKRILDTSALSTWISDENGIAVQANPACLKFFGATEVEVIRKYNLFNDEVIEKQGFMPEIRKVFEKGEIVSIVIDYDFAAVEHVNVKNATHKIINSIFTPIIDRNNKVTNVIVQTIDLTELKQAETEIRKLNSELEQRVIQRTALLEAANKELEAFSYSISHDLRTPLRAIDGFTQILLTDFQNQLDMEGKRVCNVIRENTMRMGQLIDDLLAFSRLSRSEMRFTEIKMKELVISIINDITNDKIRKKIRFDIAEICDASGDPSLIKQVWVNLLSNAIKFTMHRENPIISVTCILENNLAVYSVKDNGAGFDMMYVNKLFGVFQRLHSAKEFEGTGVGLAIVKRIIHRHGGRVWAKGEVDKGATFYFTLPVK